MKQFLAVLVLGTICAMANAKVMNCVYDTSSFYRSGKGKFTPADIDATKCSHLSYGYFGIDDSGIVQSLDTKLDIDNGFIKQVVGLKQSNPKLKVLAIVGGPQESNLKYSNMANDANSRKAFIQSAVKFLKEHNFDGLHLHWQDPTQGGGSHLDKKNIVILLKELKAALSPLKWELSVAVTGRIDIADKSYDVANLAQHVDYINVLSFNFATGSDGFLGLNAPLRGQDQRNVQESIKYWLSKGAPASKLVMGLPFFGHSFHLANLKQFNPGFPCAGPGSIGPYTPRRGFLSFNEICTLIPSWTKVFGETYGVPYIYKDKHWVSYDNDLSMQYKLDFMNEMNLAGVMVQSLDTDDFRGDCGPKNILLETVSKNVLGGSIIVTTPKPNFPSTGDCKSEGFFVNESNCQEFHQCANNIRYDFTCGVGTLFSMNTWTCVWPHEANCKNP